MGRWARGFEAAEKSFRIVLKHKISLWYSITAALVVALIAFAAFYFQIPDFLVLPAVLNKASINAPIFSYISINFFTILAIPLIYLVRIYLDSYKKSHFRTITALWLILWVIIESAALSLINYYIPEYKDAWISLQQVIKILCGILTYYVLVAIIIENTDPFTAIIHSIKGLRVTYVEALGLEVSFLLLSWILGMIYIPIGLLIHIILKNEMISALSAVLIIIPGVMIALTRFVGRTLLYLYYKKELPSSYFEK